MNGQQRPSLHTVEATSTKAAPQPVPAACAHPVILLTVSEHGAWWGCRDCMVPFAPAHREPPPEAPAPTVDGLETKEYLSVREMAQLLPYSEGTLRNMMSAGRLQLGVHYVKPAGRVMFKRRAVLAWLNGREPEA